MPGCGDGGDGGGDGGDGDGGDGGNGGDGGDGGGGGSEVFHEHFKFNLRGSSINSHSSKLQHSIDH